MSSVNKEAVIVMMMLFQVIRQIYIIWKINPLYDQTILLKRRQNHPSCIADHEEESKIFFETLRNICLPNDTASRPRKPVS